MACENPPPKRPGSLKDTTIQNPVVVSLKEQIRQHPDSIRLYDKLIDQYTADKNYNAAMAWCDSLLKQNPDLNFSYWLVKGKLQRQALLFDSAISSYKAYLQRFPDDEEALLNMANAAAEGGKKESLGMSDAMIQRSGTKEVRADGYFIKGVYFSRIKEFDKAIENFNQSIVNRYSFWEAYLEKAIAQYDQQEFEKSLATLHELLQVDPSYADAYYWQGKCYEALHQKSEALKNYDAAYGLDKTYIDAKEKADSLR